MNDKPEISVKTLNYIANDISAVSDTVYRIILNPPEDQSIDFLAGQYVMIGEQSGEMRPYSIANAPLGGQHLELHIRHTQDNTFTAGLLETLKNDSAIKIHGPMGNCICHANPDNKPIIFMAGGTGFSHSKALIEQMIAQNPEANIHLFWVAKTPADLYLSSLAHQWAAEYANFEFTPIISNVSEGWIGCTERIEKAVVDNYPDLSQHLVYASGPQDMVFTALRYFEKYGFERARMFSDAFDF